MDTEKLQKKAEDAITEVETKIKSSAPQTQQDAQILLSILLDGMKDLVERVAKLEQKNGIINL